MGERSPQTNHRIVANSWTTRIVEGALVLAAVVGACYAWPTQREAGRLHAKRLDLNRIVGEMPIREKAKYQVMLLKSENPMEFRWRIYIPEKTATTLATEGRSSTGSSNSTSSFTSNAEPAQEVLVVVTLLPAENTSNLEIKTRSRSAQSRSTSSMYLQDESIQRMAIAGDTYLWRIAGRDGVETYSHDEVLWLLTVETPNKEIAATLAGMIRIGLGTQEVLAEEQLKRVQIFQ